MDPAEIGDLYRRLGPMIYRRCARLLTDEERARDATQEVFVRAMRHRKRLLDDRECLPWLYRVATNYCLNEWRNQDKRPTISIDLLPEQSTTAEPERQLAARQSISALLRDVDLRTREIVIYRWMDGMTQEEIATVMGISRRTVGKKLSRFNESVQQLKEQVA